MSTREYLAEAAEFYGDEITDHVTYATLAAAERPGPLRELLGRIAEIEEHHSRFWLRFIAARGGPAPARPPFARRLRFLRFLRRIFNPMLLVSTLELGEGHAARKYFGFLNRAPLDESERSDLRAIILDELEHEVTFRKESQTLGLGNVRDFVLGMNDGLVEILGTVTGLSAVYASSPFTVAVSGLVVGIAGALSMGIGAFMSVRSQRQVNEGARERLSVLFAVAPERATDEYRARLVESGVPADVAAAISEKIGGNQEAVTRLLLDASEDSEVRSGLFTGGAYLVGVAFPVLPYFIAQSSLGALGGSVLLAGLALAATGGLVSVLSGIPLRRKVLEMVGAGIGAAMLSYGFGTLLDRWLGMHL